MANLSPKPAAPSENALDVLVFAPTGRDGELICELIERRGYPCDRVDDPARVADAIVQNNGIGVIAEEALQRPVVENLAHALAQQPAWSDFPLVVLISGGQVTRESQRLRVLREPLGNVLLLERPLRPETLIGVVENALRARRRQFEMRDQLEQYRKAEEALRKSEKLAVTGRLAASIAHEVNNPLESVTNLLYLIQGTESAEERAEFLRIAEHELARVTEITKQTLRFYREPGTHTAANVAEILKSVLGLYNSRLSSANVEVHTHFATVPPIMAGVGELRQLFANLVGNAIDAMRGGGRLDLRMRCVRNHVAEKDMLCVTVADTGCGIPRSVLPRIFEPFITTKEETGTGLGLWVSDEIVQKHGGKMQVWSSTREQLHGTVFRVLLPFNVAAC